MPEFWVVGVGLEILSTFSGTAGKQLIRLSELHREEAPLFARTVFHMGILINMAAGPILDMAAYSFGPQMLIAPFGGLDVVWNAALAPWILKEKLTRSRFCACALIFVGTLSSGAFGRQSEEEYTFELVQERVLNPRVLVYLLAFAVWAVFNILGPMRRPKGDLLRGISLGVTSGSIAGNMFCVKASVELIERSVRHGEVEIWLHWLPYGLLAGAAFFALSNVIFMTQGLREFEALFMVTIYEGSMLVANCLSACTVLLELDGLEAWRVFLYCLCVLTVIAGMAWVCLGEVKKETLPQEHPSGEAAVKNMEGDEVEAGGEQQDPPEETKVDVDPEAEVASPKSAEGRDSWLACNPCLLTIRSQAAREPLPKLPAGYGHGSASELRPSLAPSPDGDLRVTSPNGSSDPSSSVPSLQLEDICFMDSTLASLQKAVHLAELLESGVRDRNGTPGDTPDGTASDASDAATSPRGRVLALPEVTDGTPNTTQDEEDGYVSDLGAKVPSGRRRRSRSRTSRLSALGALGAPSSLRRWFRAAKSRYV